jgi:hypothetical protein
MVGVPRDWGVPVHTVNAVIIVTALEGHTPPPLTDTMEATVASRVSSYRSSPQPDSQAEVMSHTSSAA